LARQDMVDPRVARTRQVVLTAVIEELAHVGHADFTVESVAARCGVGKSTIYRHWEGKLPLIVDAMHELNTQPAPEPDGTPRERIRQLLHHLGHALTEGSLAPAIPALIEAAERDQQVRVLLNDYTVERRRVLVDALTSGIKTGQIDASIDPELAAQALSGAIFYARLMTSTPLTETAIDHLIHSVLGPD
jgi:TetR/AcrR family transcriptional regulator, regulator of autoinduction and epiphytic fitness